MLDVGANTGFLTLLTARHMGDGGLVIAVEPSSREFRQLLTDLSLHQANIVLALNLAGGEQPGISQLTIEPDHTGLNPIICNEERPSGRQPCQVLALAAPGLGELAVIKIDIEGFELLILRSLKPLPRNQQIHKLITEKLSLLQLHNQSSADIYKLLEKHGYRPTIGPLDKRQWDEVFTRSQEPNKPDELTS